MTLVVIVGIAATILAVEHFTRLPFWASALVGFGLFVVLFGGALFLLSRRRR